MRCTRLAPCASVVMSVIGVTLAGCGDGGGRSTTPTNVSRPVPGASAAPADPLGARPMPLPAAAYAPPVPVVYERANGLKVWLLERKNLPIVSMELVVPAGSAFDPADKGGLAWATANMLDEGAGSRGALEIARDVDRLGASLSTGATSDYAFVQLTTLTSNLRDAATIFGDVVTRPTFLPVEWKRVHELWGNELKARQADPEAVAGVVATRQSFGPNHPYGHPTSGTTKSAARVGLPDVKAFYAERFRPDLATLVVVGDVTRADLDPLLDRIFGAWKAPAKPAPAVVPAATPPSTGETSVSKATSGRRVVLVDRPDAPQSVIAVVRRGVAAGDEDASSVARLNFALGGSFTSRLNQDLREEHGWTYGAKSRFSFTRMTGIFTAQAAVETPHTGEALRAMIGDIEGFAKSGLTEEEVGKTRVLARADLVESFETVEAAARRLSRNAGVGLPADHEVKASARMDRASAGDLARLAGQHTNPADALVVIVGPRQVLKPQLDAIGMTEVTTLGPEGE